MQSAIDANATSIDPTPFFEESLKQFGTEGAKMAIERIKGIAEDQKVSVFKGHRYREWGNIESLSSLFSGSSNPPEIGMFIDQRYIDFLNRNEHKLGEMHWRKFEELTAEYFHRQGYEVQLGPGSGDDGIDLRVWNRSDTNDYPPLMIVQCKRHKNKKVEKVVVKGLYADILDSGADIGLLVTSTALSPVARDTINLRGYPIEEIDNVGVKSWVKELRTPGTGIVRC
jgi:restriction system protein